MALNKPSAGDQALAADLNQYADHLEGASGSTLSWFLRCATSQNFVVRLSDNGGTQKFSIQDSDGAEVAAINSDGDLSLSGAFTPGTITLPTGSAPSPTTEGEVWWDSDDDQFVVGTGAGSVGIGAGTTDHGTLFGLTDDDHTQYLKEKASGGTAAETPSHDHSTAAEAGTIAHSVTTGKTANDHHNQSHAMGSSSDHTATAWRMFYSDAGGDVDEMSLGANGTFLESNGTSSIPAFRSLTAADITGTPGGELGGTFSSFTVDTTHSGTSHAGVISTHESAYDHTQIPTFLNVTSDVTYTTDTSVATITGLSFTGASNADYAIWGCLMVTESNPGGDMDLKFTLPSGAVAHGQADPNTTGHPVFSGSTEGQVGLTDGTTSAVKFSAVVDMAATGGTVGLQAAQNGATGSLIIEKGSWLAYIAL